MIVLLQKLKTIRTMLSAEDLRKFFEIYPQNLSEPLKKAFQENTELITLQKGETVINSTETDFYVYCIYKGSCVRYIINSMEEERAVMFHTEDFLPMLSASYIGYENAVLSYSVRANEPMEVFRIPVMPIRQWAVGDPQYLLFSAQRFLSFFQTESLLHNHLIGLSKEAFLQWLWNNYGFLFQRFSAKDIASFMGVSPTWLSLLKKKLLKKAL